MTMADYDKASRFKVHIEKARSMMGEGATPSEAVEPFTTERCRRAIRYAAIIRLRLRTAADRLLGTGQERTEVGAENCG